MTGLEGIELDDPDEPDGSSFKTILSLEESKFIFGEQMECSRHNAILCSMSDQEVQQQEVEEPFWYLCTSYVL